MPVYNWACTKCGKHVDILRDFDGHRDPPTAEESKPNEACEHAEWEKNIGAPKMVRGAGWKGSKGNWAWAALLLSGIGSTLCGVR